ncbi:MAG: GNAT family N-acetyltransferase [Streptosporangiaceae bacterium]
MPDVLVRDAAEADFAAIAAITIATGQHEDWTAANPAYIGHLMRHGRVVVAERDGKVAGFGAVQRLGSGPDAVTMLCDLFVDPAVHGSGCGRAMLTSLLADSVRRMTFSSLHSHAIPLYTSFGLDAWWPLLYLHGEADRLPGPVGWSAELAGPDEVAQLELGWTGVDRTADHHAWAARPGGAPVIVSAGGEVFAVGTVIAAGPDRGIEHVALSPAADDAAAAWAVLAVLADLDAVARGAAQQQLPFAGPAHVCLPGPHPAVRPLLAAGWQFDEFDLFMATEPDLLDPRRAVPSPGQA